MTERRGLWFILGGVLFVLIVLAAARIVLAPFRPEEEIRRMLQAMSEVETFKERSAFSWTRGEGNERATTSLYTIGQVDVSASLQHVTKFRVFQVSPDTDYLDISGEARTIDGTTYVDTDGLWISMGEEDVQGLSALNDFGIPFARLSSEEGIARSRSLLANADVLLVQYNNLSEHISDHSTRVMDAKFDPDALRAFLRDVIRETEGREPTDAERLRVETQADALDGLALRLWIGADDHLLYRFQAAGTVPESFVNPGSDKASTVLVPVDVIVELSEFNASFEGEASAEFVPLSGAVGQFLAGAEEGGLAYSQPRDTSSTDTVPRLPRSASVTEGDPDSDGLSNIVEAFYRTDAQNADTDGDGISDGEEVLDGKNPRGEGTLFGFGFGE